MPSRTQKSTSLPSIQPRFISMSDGAAYTATSVDTLRRAIARGELTAYRAGRKLIRLDLAELDAWLKPVPTAALSGDAA